MSTPHDKLGNAFMPGQFVQIHITTPVLLAQIQSVEHEGRVGGRDGMVTPARVVIVAVIPIEVLNSDGEVQGVMVLQQPRNPQTSQESKVSH